MVWCPLVDNLERPEGALAGQCPGGLHSGAVRYVLCGGRHHNWCVEDLRRDCRDREVASRSADQHDAPLADTNRTHGVQTRC
jgi:hypothetical protein